MASEAPHRVHQRFLEVVGCLPRRERISKNLGGLGKVLEALELGFVALDHLHEGFFRTLQLCFGSLRKVVSNGQVSRALPHGLARVSVDASHDVVVDARGYVGRELGRGDEAGQKLGPLRRRQRVGVDLLDKRDVGVDEGEVIAVDVALVLGVILAEERLELR